jgi:hypothetical protein
MRSVLGRVEAQEILMLGSADHPQGLRLRRGIEEFLRFRHCRMLIVGSGDDQYGTAQGID